jgi:hypothetical protein
VVLDAEVEVELSLDYNENEASVNANATVAELFVRERVTYESGGVPGIG